MDLFPLGQLSKDIRQRRIEKFQVKILEHGKATGKPFYLDEVDFDSLLCGDQRIDGKHPNMIGIAVRILLQREAISLTGQFRKSEKQGSKGRRIFEYRLGK